MSTRAQSGLAAMQQGKSAVFAVYDRFVDKAPLPSLTVCAEAKKADWLAPAEDHAPSINSLCVPLFRLVVCYFIK